MKYRMTVLCKEGHKTKTDVTVTNIVQLNLIAWKKLYAECNHKIVDVVQSEEIRD